MRRENLLRLNLSRHPLSKLNRRRLHWISRRNSRFLNQRQPRRRHLRPRRFQTATPTPSAAPVATPAPENSPRPKSSPKPHPEPAVKPAGTPNSHPAPVPGLSKGSVTGATNGTGNGGPRSGLLLRSPRPPYPPLALQLHISGDVRVTITVEGGNIVDTEGSGPPMLASAAARWVKANWKFNPTANGTFTLPVSFVLAQ